MRIQGKQLAYDTIEQNNLSLNTPSSPSDAARKDYVDSLINSSLSVERLSKENQNMVGNYSTGVTYLACEVPILEDTIYKSQTEVYVNGMKVSCGSNTESFFSPDGILKRSIDDVRIGDRLYWNTTYSDYLVDSGDTIDFKYLTNDSQIAAQTINVGESFTVTTDDKLISLKFTGDIGETATLIIDTVSFTIGNVGGFFVFDIGDTNGLLHTFTYLGENYYIVVNSNPYNIIWNGTSSLILSIVKNYPFDITRYSGPVTYSTSINGDEPTLSVTDNYMVVGSNSPYLYLYEKSNGLWTNKQTIYSSFVSSCYLARMTDNHIISSDRSGNFVVFDYDSGTTTWDSGTTLQSSSGGGYEVYGYIDDNQIIVGDGRANSLNGLTRIYTQNTGGTWDYVTLTNPGSVGLGRTGVLLKKNNVAVAGTWDYNKIFVYNYISGTSWSSGIELDRLPGELTTLSNVYSGNLVLDIKDNLILCGAYGVDYSGTNTGTAYIYEYSGGTWNLSQLPFPSGDTTNLLLGSCGRIVTYDGNTGSTYDTGGTYLFVGTKITSASLGKFFIYKKSGSTWELYNQVSRGYCDVAFDVNNQLDIVSSSNSTIYSLPFHGHQIDKAENRNGVPVIDTLSIDGTKTIGNQVTLNYNYSHPTRVSENTISTSIVWYSRSYLSESYTERTDLNGLATVDVDSNLYGKHVSVYVTPIDENGNEGSVLSRSETLLETNNSDFNTQSTVAGQSIILTIISGNDINGNGAGVYVLLGTGAKQNSTTSSWSIGFNSGGHNIYIYGTSGGYNSMSLTINGGATYTYFTDTTQTGYVSDNLFTQYTLGGTTFTISKNTGWR